MRMSIFIFFVTGSYSAIQFSFRGVNRFDGTFTFLYSAFFPESSATPRGANTGRRGSSGISVSSPVSVFTIASPFPSVCFVTFPMTTAGRDSLAARVAAAVESPPRRTERSRRAMRRSRLTRAREDDRGRGVRA